jgi:hypothetical protein
LGVEVNGRAGVVGLPKEKVEKLVSLSLWLLEQSVCTRKTLQIVAGHWCHAIQLRREASSALQGFWRAIGGGPWRFRRRPVSREVKGSLVRLLVYLPLLLIDLRLLPSPVVSCPDASEAGGGVCVSRGLSWWGKRQVLYELGKEGWCRDRLGLVALGDPLGSLRRALDVIGVEVTFALHLPCSVAGRRGVRAAWPDTILADDFKALLQLLEGQLWECPRVTHVCVFIGQPAGDSVWRIAAWEDIVECWTKYEVKVWGLLSSVEACGSLRGHVQEVAIENPSLFKFFYCSGPCDLCALDEAAWTVPPVRRGHAQNGYW